jgi:mono/diheme cytochrome c family protein
MRSFFLGILFVIVVAVVVGLGAAFLGYFPTRANVSPPAWEERIASVALDASMEKHAARTASPVPFTDENLIAGMKIYTMNCSLCHGTLDKKPSALEHSFYPPPPQLILEPVDDPEWHTFYAIRTGVRYTGMPAWDKAMSEEDAWKVTGFLSRVDKLPPAVKEYWQKSFGTTPPSEGESQSGERHHD